MTTTRLAAKLKLNSLEKGMPRSKKWIFCQSKVRQTGPLFSSLDHNYSDGAFGKMNHGKSWPQPLVLLVDLPTSVTSLTGRSGLFRAYTRCRMEALFFCEYPLGNMWTCWVRDFIDVSTPHRPVLVPLRSRSDCIFRVSRNPLMSTSSEGS